MTVFITIKIYNLCKLFCVRRNHYACQNRGARPAGACTRCLAELGVKDYAPLVLSSNDTGIIIDPGVGSGLALTREMLQTLKAQLEFFEQMRNTAAEMGVDFDADAVAEAARNITADDDAPEGRSRKERRWFGKKKK